MPLLAEVTDDDVLRIVARIGEIIVTFSGSVAAVWYVIRSRRQDVRERDIKLSRDQWEAEHERDEAERQTRREERDHVIEEIRGLLDEARDETRELKREQKKVQEVTARKMAEIQAAHHACEKNMAAQAVQISHLTEVNQLIRNDLAVALQRIKELEDRSDENHAPAS